MTSFSRHAAFMGFLLLIGGARLSAAPTDFVGQRVVAIQYQPVQQPVLAKELAELITLKEGQPLKLEDVRASIEKLFGTGRYRDISVEAETQNGGVLVRFVTVNNNFVNRVTVEGVPDPPNRGQLVNATKLDFGSLYYPSRLRTAVENLQEILRRNGFYEAQITSATEVDPLTEQIDIAFTIDPGKRSRYAPPVISGHPNRPAKEIYRATSWQRLRGLLGWRQVTESLTQSGVDNVRKSYQKKNRLLAKVVLEGINNNEETDRATPTLNIEGGPTVTVKTRGYKIRQGTLRKLVPIYQEQAVDDDLLAEGKRNILQKLEADGYFEATADFERNVVSPDKTEIDYTIDRGDKHKLVSLEINGNRYFDDLTIRERMNVTPSSFLRYRNGRYSEALLRRDMDAIADLYRGNGFRDVKVEKRVNDAAGGKQHRLAVALTITEGQQSRVRSVAFEGVSQQDQDYLVTLLHSGEGQPYSDLNVAADQDTVLNYYFNNGYPDATFEAQPSGDQTNVDLKYTIKPGRQVFVRQVLTSGLEATRESIVNDRLELKAGDPLSQSKLIDTQRRLYDLGIFARVDAAEQNPDGDEKYKFVMYRFEEAHKYSLNIGVGAEFGRIGGGGTTNLNSPGGSTGFSPRFSLGISRSNFLGLANTLSLQTRYSNLQRRAQLTYLAPQYNGNENLTVTLSGLYDNSKDVRTFAATRYETSAQVQQRLSKANSIQYRLTYRKVDLDVSTLKVTPNLIPVLAQPTRTGLISATFIQDRRDDPIDSRKGMYNTIDFAFASRWLFSRTPFVRTIGRNTTYHRIGKDLIFARTINIGLIQPTSGGGEITTPGAAQSRIPLPERFFAGGVSSHRGFSENQAGPRDLATGFPVGGNASLVNQFELRFPLLGDNIGGVVFLDSGNVYSRVGKISFRYKQRDITDFDYAVQAPGIGIRYKTPIGPVRVDLGYALNPPQFRGCQGTTETLLFNCDPNNPADAGNFAIQRLSRFTFHFSLGQSF